MARAILDTTLSDLNGSVLSSTDVGVYVPVAVGSNPTVKISETMYANATEATSTLAGGTTGTLTSASSSSTTPGRLLAFFDVPSTTATISVPGRVQLYVAGKVSMYADIVPHPAEIQVRQVTPYNVYWDGSQYVATSTTGGRNYVHATDIGNILVSALGAITRGVIHVHPRQDAVNSLTTAITVGSGKGLKGLHGKSHNAGVGVVVTASGTFNTASDMVTLAANSLLEDLVLDGNARAVNTAITSGTAANVIGCTVANGASYSMQIASGSGQARLQNSNFLTGGTYSLYAAGADSMVNSCHINTGGTRNLFVGGGFNYFLNCHLTGSSAYNTEVAASIASFNSCYFDSATTGIVLVKPTADIGDVRMVNCTVMMGTGANPTQAWEVDLTSGDINGLTIIGCTCRTGGNQFTNAIKWTRSSGTKTLRGGHIDGNTFGDLATTAGWTSGLAALLGTDVGDCYVGRNSVFTDLQAGNSVAVTRNWGTTNVADAGNISHGLAASPGAAITNNPTLSGGVLVTTRVADETAAVDSVGSSNFRVQLTKADGTAGTTQDVSWTAWVPV